MNQQQQTGQAHVSSNLGYQDFNMLQLRLDTQKLHKDIYNFLTGKTQIVEFNKETETYSEKDIPLGIALANSEGIQNLLNFIVNTVNSHTVQGNTEKKELYEILYFINIHLAQQLTLNCEKWGIDKKNRRHILNTLLVMIQLFLSRTIDNKERDGLQPMIQKEIRTDTITQPKKLL